ncbi:MAG: 4-oxalomesaconate hydratase, partial [Novosphingobium sp. 16-62-11]
MTMIIDCHGHYTVLPKAHDEWREKQKAAFKAGEAAPPYPDISDDEIRETIESNQLRLLKERGADMTIFSPRASAMAPHVGDQSVAVKWAQVCNDLIARVVGLYPETFAGVCMLPQSPEADMTSSIAELDRCVNELGFIGCNLNPDPGGGRFTHPPLTDEYWFPFYEKMVELDVPAMIHVSGSCNPAMHAT